MNKKEILEHLENIEPKDEYLKEFIRQIRKSKD